jgi:Spy/CpxP family protein refolding chaperone
MKTRTYVWSLVALSVVSMSSAMAQPRGQGGPGGAHGQVVPMTEQDKAMRERMVEIRGRALRERAGLSEASAQKAEKVLDSLEADRKKQRSRAKEANRQLRELIRENSDDQAAYKAQLKEMNDARRALQSLEDKEQEELAKVLTPKEQALTVMALRELKQHARDMREEGGRRGPPDGRRDGGRGDGRGGPPPGGPMGDPDDDL